MGCCASQTKPDYRSDSGNTSYKQVQLAWNTDLFQARNFSIDQANIRLTAAKHKPHRIVSRQAFPDTGKFQLKIRYVSQHVSSFSIGVFHFGSQVPTPALKAIGQKKAIRLYLSKNEGEIRSEGQNLFFSKNWRANLQDTIIMTVDMNAHVVEWKKQNTLDTLIQKTPFPRSFQNKQLFVELIMYETDTQLNIQV